jgi:hypothetical protein
LPIIIGFCIEMPSDDRTYHARAASDDDHE